MGTAATANAGENYVQSQLSGVIGNGTGGGSVAIYKQGVGGWELTNNGNTFTGGVNISAGNIEITQPKALGTGAVNVAAGRSWRSTSAGEP